MKKEDMKKKIDDMTEGEYEVFTNDAVRGAYLRDWCPTCDDFKTCGKTAERLDDCRNQLEMDIEGQRHEKW